jgi:hypothetical protein
LGLVSALTLSAIRADAKAMVGRTKTRARGRTDIPGKALANSYKVRGRDEIWGQTQQAHDGVEKESASESVIRGRKRGTHLHPKTCSTSHRAVLRL